MVSSYREEVNKYKEKKHSPTNDAPMPHRKKKKKKHKKSDHKHIYVPGIYHSSYTSFNGNKRDTTSVGYHCKYCGRIQYSVFPFLYTDNEKYIEDFKEKNPTFVELDLPDCFECLKTNHIPKELL